MVTSVNKNTAQVLLLRKFVLKSAKPVFEFRLFHLLVIKYLDFFNLILLCKMEIMCVSYGFKNFKKEAFIRSIYSHSKYWVGEKVCLAFFYKRHTFHFHQ